MLISEQVWAVRSRILASIRDFFRNRGFLEVETPVRIPTPALELHIDAIPAAGGFLRTSPELHMKRLLADGLERIFQMGPSFREGESGPHHHPEFTMLEWYRAGADYRDILQDARELIQYTVQQVFDTDAFDCNGRRLSVASDRWEEWTVSEAFLAHAGWDPVADYDADRFDLDLVADVEPAMPTDKPVVLMDYPEPAAALARCRGEGNGRVAERWELYLGGLELANAFSELTDPAEQRRRFEQCAHDRERLGKAVYPMDEAFLDALASGLPPCGGAALGVDRLVMLLTGSSNIADVRPFVDR
jgi:lysyl-tRNA synthetase class 2